MPSLPPLFPTRETAIKLFLSATIEGINEQVDAFLREQHVCIGNYIKSHLYKHGGVYQYELVYAVLVQPKTP